MSLFIDSLSSNRTENVTFETCKINSLEHVEVYFKVESPRSGQLKLDLLSSSGTISNIIPGRFLDLNRMNMNMTVITVHFWGESSIGKWTLMPGDISGNDLMLSNGMNKLKLISKVEIIFDIISIMSIGHSIPVSLRNCLS